MNKDLINIIIVTYTNDKKYIKSSINSILSNQVNDLSFEIIVVDNCSTDGTVEVIKENFPDLKIIVNKENVGYGPAMNIGVKHSKGKYIVILNPDTKVTKSWLEELVKPLKESKKLITTPKVLRFDGEHINSCGLIAHFTGLGFTRGLNEDRNEYNKTETVNALFGCCIAINRDDFNELGGFDENLFFYMDDIDLSWKAHLNGFKILYVPNSIMLHDYTLKVSANKIYNLEKGRYIILRKYLDFSDFIVTLPSLLLVEILTFGYAIKYGFKGIYFKIKAYEGLNTKIDKVEGDKIKLIKSLDNTIPIDHLTYNIFDKWIKIIFNAIFELNWRLFNYWRAIK